jgi:CheY-like chemotaxis protein
VLSTSKINEDITRCYKDGADSHIAKPVAVADLIEAVKLLGKYWLETVSLPPYETGG